MASKLVLQIYRRSNKAFTLIELMIAVVIIGVLAAIALPNFIGAQLRAKAVAVKANMRTTQIAAENYAIDSAGSYPAIGSDYRPYLPGGSNSMGGSPGSYPNNPVTGVMNEQPVNAGPNSSAGIIAARQTDAVTVQVPPGKVTFRQADNGDSYAVAGGDPNGFAISGLNGKVLILSNQ